VADGPAAHESGHIQCCNPCPPPLSPLGTAWLWHRVRPPTVDGVQIMIFDTLSGNPWPSPDKPGVSGITTYGRSDSLGSTPSYRATPVASRSECVQCAQYWEWCGTNPFQHRSQTALHCLFGLGVVFVSGSLLLSLFVRAVREYSQFSRPLLLWRRCRSSATATVAEGLSCAISHRQ
jgi:hypothetical protein